MIRKNNTGRQNLLETAAPASAIITLAVPATLALLAKAVYNITDTAFIGLLHSDISMAAVGVTVPLLLIMVSLENIFAAGAAVLAGRQLGAGKKEGAERTVTTIFGISMLVGIFLCISGLIFMDPLMRTFGASDTVLPEARQYAFWMFIAALFNLPAQSLNCAARAESSVKISSIAVITGAALNVLLDPVFMFEWGFDMGVEGASLATTVSQFVTFCILSWYYASGRSVIKIRAGAFRPSWDFLRRVIIIGVPTAIIQICLAAASSLTNIAAKGLPDADLLIAAYGIVQRLVLIGCYIVMGLMQGYQPIAAYAFGAKNEKRFLDSVHFTLKATLGITFLVEILFILLASTLISLFNGNLRIISYGAELLISQMLLFPSFGICYMMTITFQTIGSAGYGLFLSDLRQGICYTPLILLLPQFMGLKGICLAQPAADIITLLICILSIPVMKRTASRNMGLDRKS